MNSHPNKKICAVIPAAGKGTRLKADVPKILVPVLGELTIWDILLSHLKPVVDHIHVVLSPEGLPHFQKKLASLPESGFVSTSIQDTPLGMGDAIFRGQSEWSHFDDILVIWGDQVHVSETTLKNSIASHLQLALPRFSFPVVSMKQPYVEYLFDEKNLPYHVLQSREGDKCHPGGWGDIGTFLLSTRDLPQAWSNFLALSSKGAATGEINFLPFLPYLAQKENWNFTKTIVTDENEARGINTPEDLEFFRSLYEKER